MTTAHETTNHAPVAVQMDLYRDVHKGLRNAVFSVTLRAGSADLADEAEARGLVAAIHETIGLIRAHAAHEDHSMQPAIEAHAPDLLAAVTADHARCDAHLSELAHLADTVGDTGDARRHAAGSSLYSALGDFAAFYLGHMATEEQQVMPRLAAAMPVDKLVAIQRAIQGTVPPDLMVVFLRHMLPAMDVVSRTAMLGDMRANAPAEIFATFWATARDVLAPSQAAVVAKAIGEG